MKLFVAMTMPD